MLSMELSVISTLSLPLLGVGYGEFLYVQVEVLFLCGECSNAISRVLANVTIFSKEIPKYVITGNKAPLISNTLSDTKLWIYQPEFIR